MPSVAQFEKAMAKMHRPGGKVCQFLQAHADANGRAATMTQLAMRVQYKSMDGMNLQYGLLAARIGAAMNVENPDISLLVAPIKPTGVTNRNWVLVMEPNFAEAAKRVGWIR